MVRRKNYNYRIKYHLSQYLNCKRNGCIYVRNYTLVCPKIIIMKNNINILKNCNDYEVRTLILYFLELGNGIHYIIQRYSYFYVDNSVPIKNPPFLPFFLDIIIEIK